VLRILFSHPPAVIDDMIALVILSQLSALTGEVSIGSVLIPIVSAILFLVLGGYISIVYIPGRFYLLHLIFFLPYK